MMKIALVLVLQAHAIAQAAHVVPQVQAAGRPVAGENAFLLMIPPDDDEAVTSCSSLSPYQ